MISEAALIHADNEVVACAFGEGLALLDLRSGQYFAVNDVGAFVWSQLSKPARVADIRQAMLRHYNTTEAQCSTDLQSWLEAMTRAKLIEASDVVAA